MRINRGKLGLREVAEKALELGVEKVVIIDRWNKGFGKIEFFEVGHNGLTKAMPIVYLQSVKFRRDFGEQNATVRKTKSIAAIIGSKENFETRKFEEFLADFFNVPALSLPEVLNNNYDVAAQISTEPFERMTITFRLIPELVEAGPQLTISHLAWERAQ
jgi:rRNA maturation protein Rpf1